jgi:hypothetical protein
MLSNADLNDGMLFILQLQTRAGEALQWIQTLRGDVARRWYSIYQSSDWEALRIEAAGVFQSSVTQAQMDDVLKLEKRCVYIHTPLVKVEDLRAEPSKAPGAAKQ